LSAVREDVHLDLARVAERTANPARGRRRLRSARRSSAIVCCSIGMRLPLPPLLRHSHISSKVAFKHFLSPPLDGAGEGGGETFQLGAYATRRALTGLTIARSPLQPPPAPLVPRLPAARSRRMAPRASGWTQTRLRCYIKPSCANGGPVKNEDQVTRSEPRFVSRVTCGGKCRRRVRLRKRRKATTKKVRSCVD
jgi:hypothetical protein